VVLTVAVVATTIAVAPAAAQVGGQAVPKAPASAQHPKVELLDPVHDFGAVMEGQPVSHTFKVRNAGGAELLIDHVQTTCGCTVAEPSRKRLKPGEEAEIAVTFDTRYQKGHRQRVITLYSNDPQTPSATMTLQGDVKTEVEASPEEIAFNKVRQGTEETRQLALTYVGKGRDFRVEKISNSSPHIKVTQAANKDGKPGAMISVTMLKSMPAGPFDDTIDIATNHQAVQVHVFGRVVGDLTLDPAQISFGIVPHGQGTVRILRLTNSGAGAVQITGVSSTSQSVAAKVDPVASGKEYKITVELRRGTPDGELRGALSIKTDNPQQPSLSVPFYGVVGAFEG
jgi:hypothetical protein